MFRSDIEKAESQSHVVETNSSSEVHKHGRTLPSMPVMDVVDRLRLNLFKIERLQSKLSLALSEVSQIAKKK